jgi:sec-independent protein translocase protein TatA
MNHLLIFNIGGSEAILIMFVVLLFFGAKGVPDIAKSLGRATREFKDAMNGIEREIRDAATETPATKPDEPKKVEEHSEVKNETSETPSSGS